MRAIEQFEENSASFSPAVIRRHSLQFAREHFQARMAAFISLALDGPHAESPPPPVRAEAGAFCPQAYS